MEISGVTALVAGVLCLGFGAYTLIVRIKAPQKFGKLEAMKKLWGPKWGNVIHVAAYTGMPFLLGLIFLANYFLL